MRSASFLCVPLLSLCLVDAGSYRIHFIGKGGRILKETEGATAAYRFEGGEDDLRSRVTDSNGRCAGTQPVRVTGAAR